MEFREATRREVVMDTTQVNPENMRLSERSRGEDHVPGFHLYESPEQGKV